MNNIRRIFVSVVVPDEIDHATDKEVEEWVEYRAGWRDTVSKSNPFFDYMYTKGEGLK